MGKQVAYNREPQLRAKIVEHNGRKEITIEEKVWDGLIRGEYPVIGTTLQFPRKWGKKEGANKLLTHLIDQQEAILKRTTEYLADLKRMQEDVSKWPVSK